MRPLWILALLLGLGVCAPAAARTVYPLSVGADGRHVYDGLGRAVFFNADTPWHIFARLTRDEISLYLEDRERRGFNALLVSLIVADGYTGTDKNAYGVRPFAAEGDFSRPNEAYFAHIDWALEQAQQLGFTVFLVPAYMGYACNEEGWCAEMRAAGVDQMRTWGAWVGNRYKDQPNIVWVHGGDVDAAAYDAMDVHEAVVEGIRSVDALHLNTAHCKRQLSGADCYDLPWLQVNTSYSDCQLSAQKVAVDYKRSPTRPFVYLEGIYEHENDWSDRCLRSQAYWALLGGAFGHFFGSGRVWDFPSGWQVALGSQGARSMQSMEALRRSRPWAELRPDFEHRIVVSGYGDLDGPDYAAVAATPDGRCVLAYLPSARTIGVDMEQLSGESAWAWWFNPATGTATRIGSFATSGTRSFTPPSQQDWVLVLDDAAAELKAPGQGDFVPDDRVGWGRLKSQY